MSQNLDRIHQSDPAKNLRLAMNGLEIQAKRNWTLHATKSAVVRLHVVVSDVLRRLTSADPLLVPEQLLSGLADPSNEVFETAQTIEDLGLDDGVNIDEYDRVADKLLLVAKDLPPPRPLLDEEEVRIAVNLFRRETSVSLVAVKEELEQSLSQLESVKEQTEGFAEESKRKHEESKAETDRLLSAFRDEVSGEAQRFVDQASESLSQAQEALEVATSAKNNLDQELEQSRSTLVDLLDRHERQFKDAESLRDVQHLEQTNKIFGEIEQLGQRARSMLQEVAGAAWAEHYSKLSKQQTEYANRWRKIGVTTLVGAAIVTILTVAGQFALDLLASERGITLATRLSGFGAAASLLILATYALRQSGHHRRIETDAGRIANELMLVWPFVDPLPEEERRAMLSSIIPLYFAGGAIGRDVGDNVGWADKLVDRMSGRKKQE